MYKNATTYVLQKSMIEIFGSIYDLEDKLAELSHTPIGSNELEKFGWVPVITGGTALVHTIGGDMVLRLRRDKKSIPEDAIKSELQDQIEDIKVLQGRVVNAKERREIKDRIIQKHLPTAPVKTIYHHVLISKGISIREDLLIVDTASDKVSDEVTSFLRKTIGSLPIHSLSCEKQPTSVYRNWMQVDNEEMLGQECVLIQGDGKGQISFTNQENLVDVTSEHLEAGMVIKQLMIRDDDRSFVVNDNLVLKKIKPVESFEHHYTESIEEMDALEAMHFLSRALILTTIEWIIKQMGGVYQQDLEAA